MRQWRMVLALVTVLALLVPASLAMAANPFGNSYSLWATLNGANDIPPGDPDGFGFAKVTVNMDSGQICYRLSVTNTDAAVAAHIHEGAAGVNGPVVVPFEAPIDGLGKGCVDVDMALLEAIVANPSGYYVNIHSGMFPAGVVRGQLMMEGEAAVEPPAGGPTVTTVVDGLNGPRGIAIGADGMLYVAQAGVGGDDCYTDESGEEPMELCFGPTGEITQVMPGMTHPVMAGVPSFGFNPPEYVGAQDVVIGEDGTIYGIVGAGMDPNIRDAAGEAAAGLGTVIVSDGAGGWDSVLDISAHELAENPDGGLYDSNPFQAARGDGGWAITDAGANALLWVDDDSGSITTLAVFPDTMVDAPPFLGLPPGTQIPMQAVPTGVAMGPDGAWYVGQLTGFPFVQGAAKIWRIMPGEDPTVYAEGFTNIVDIAFGPDGMLWALEITAGGLLNVDETDPATMAGALYRVGSDGQKEEMLSDGLVTPSGIAIGSNGDIYISNYGLMPGMGEIIEVSWE